MLDAIAGLGRWALSALERLGRGFLFLLSVLGGLPPLLSRPFLLLREMHSVGVMSL